MSEFKFSFGFDGGLDEPGKEAEVKTAIRDYFADRDDTEFIEFLGNPDSVPADVMNCLIETQTNGYNILDELSGDDGDSLDNGVYAISGQRESW